MAAERKRSQRTGNSFRFTGIGSEISRYHAAPRQRDAAFEPVRAASWRITSRPRPSAGLCWPVPGFPAGPGTASRAQVAYAPRQIAAIRTRPRERSRFDAGGPPQAGLLGGLPGFSELPAGVPGEDRARRRCGAWVCVVSLPGLSACAARPAPASGPLAALARDGHRSFPEPAGCARRETILAARDRPLAVARPRGAGT
jgi:hypothetical protein